VLFTVEIVAEGVAEVQLDDTRVCPGLVHAVWVIATFP
jgi:hypothetical protein